MSYACHRLDEPLHTHTNVIKSHPYWDEAPTLTVSVQLYGNEVGWPWLLDKMVNSKKRFLKMNQYGQQHGNGWIIEDGLWKMNSYIQFIKNEKLDETRHHDVSL